MKIFRVIVEMMPDNEPDLSHLGEYSRVPGKGCIDRRARGDMGHGQYRYFIPAVSGEESGNPDSPEEDYRRMEAYNRGEWCMMGIAAKAEVGLTAYGPLQVIRSGGLWSIESDSDDDFFKEVEDEQLGELRGQLRAVGFEDEAIDAAFQNVERKECG